VSHPHPRVSVTNPPGPSPPLWTMGRNSTGGSCGPCWLIVDTACQEPSPCRVYQTLTNCAVPILLKGLQLPAIFARCRPARSSPARARAREGRDSVVCASLLVILNRPRPRPEWDQSQGILVPRLAFSLQTAWSQICRPSGPRCSLAGCRRATLRWPGGSPRSTIRCHPWCRVRPLSVLSRPWERHASLSFPGVEPPPRCSRAGRLRGRAKKETCNDV